jgi:hypothetical protein
MDVQAIRERLEKLTYRQLQQEAKKNGVKARGTKEKLLKNLIKKLALEPFDSSFSSSAADTTGQTLDTTTQSTYSKVDKGSSNGSSAVNVDVSMNENISSATEEVNLAASVAADTTNQVLDKADESLTPPSITTTSAAMNESIFLPENEEDNSTADVAADTTQTLELTYTKVDEKSSAEPPVEDVDVAMNENVSSVIEEVNSTASVAADVTIHVLDTGDEEPSAVPSVEDVDVSMDDSRAIEEVNTPAKVAADTTTPVLDKGDKESSAEPPVEDVDVAMNENVSSAFKEVNSAACVAADVTIQVLDKNDEESLSPPSTTTTSAVMNENALPKKQISGGSPLKSPGVARQRFIDLHQRAAQQMTDIETDQKRKEERHGALTQTWTPNINKLSKPKFATPSKKVPESPYKRRRSTTIETGTPSKKRHCQGLTYPELTPRLAVLAQPKTPPRPVSRNRAQSVARMSYTPHKGAYHFVDTTGMSDEKFKEYKKQIAETR